MTCRTTCRGCLVGHVNNRGKTSTANNVDDETVALLNAITADADAVLAEAEAEIEVAEDCAVLV